MLEEQVIGAIQGIIDLCNVLQNIKVFIELDKNVESNIINLDSFKLKYSKSLCQNNSDIHDLFDVILLEHDNVKTLYLIKGLEVIVSDNKSVNLSKSEIEKVKNLDRTVRDRGVAEALYRVLKGAGLFPRYKRIVEL